MMSSVQRRIQRSTAGKTSKFVDFSLVSFPHVKKHSIIKTSLINIDPLSSAGAKEGTIKAYGKRKHLLVIKSGSRLEVEEAASRFSKESGSEELIIPRQELNNLHEEDEESSDEVNRDSDDTFEDKIISSKRSNKSQESLNLSNTSSSHNQQRTSLQRTTSTCLDTFDKENFDRVLLIESANNKPTTKRKRTTNETDESSYSLSGGSDVEGDRWSKSKENFLRTNIDLNNINTQKQKRKKKKTTQLIVETASTIDKSILNDIELLKKRVSKLEKVYGIIRRNTAFDQSKQSSMSSIEFSKDVSVEIQRIFGIHPKSLKSPINRPTKIMRELFKHNGHELSKWKEVFEPNELLLKDFIQQKCLVLDEDLPHVWSLVVNSMTQMPYDAVKYKSKSLNKDLVMSATNVSSETTRCDSSMI